MKSVTPGQYHHIYYLELESANYGSWAKGHVFVDSIIGVHFFFFFGLVYAFVLQWQRLVAARETL